MAWARWRTGSSVSRSAPDPLRPPDLRATLARDQSLEQLDALAEALVDREQQVLVLHAEHVVVPDGSEGADEVTPHLLALAVADRSERPCAIEDLAVVLGIEDAVARDVAAVDVRVLRVDVEDRAFTPEHLDRLDDVDALPEQVAG